MINSQPLPVEIVSQPAHLSAAVRELARSDVIALDTESNSLHHYPEQLCLIQIASRLKIYIIDTIALPDIAPLRAVLSDVSVTKVIHSADYDIRSLDRHSGLHIRGVFDTSIAASFVGITRLGLESVIREILGINIEKSKSLQRADWGRRPLSAGALEYAASDVRYLIALWENLDQRLQTLGRAAWVTEECARIEEVRYTIPNMETAYLSVKGSRDLDGRQLAVLRSLWLFREEEAINQQRPPFFVLPDTTLIFLATNPKVSLSDVPGLGQSGLKRFGKNLQQALYSALTAAPVHRPFPIIVTRPTQEQMKRLNQLKEWRTSLGSSLSLDPSLLWPAASLGRLARAPDTLIVELASDSIRHWQRDIVAASLRTYLKSLG